MKNSKTELNYSFNFGLNNPELAGMLENTFGNTAAFESSAGGFGYATATGILDFTNASMGGQMIPFEGRRNIAVDGSKIYSMYLPID